MSYTVKKAAQLSGVTVRTLHHYGHLGLLVPSALSPAGYRLYSDDDLARLQQILFFRELGFELKAIGPILDRPDFNRRAALQTHRKVLVDQRHRLQTLIDTVDRTIDALQKETPMKPEELFEGFDQDQVKAWNEEARERWGRTDAYTQSQERTARYTKADWDAIKIEQERINQGMADLMERSPTDADVQTLVEAHYRQLNERFYDCPIEQYRCMSNIYVDDPRFAANYDKVRPGLSKFMRDAVHAFCDARAGG